MTLSRCETDIMDGAVNGVQQKEMYGGFVSVRCTHTPSQRTSMNSDCLSFTVIYIGRGTNTNQCVIIFLLYSLNLIFFCSNCFSSGDRTPFTHSHTYKCERRKKRCSSNVFFLFVATSIRNQMVSFFFFRKIAIWQLIFVNRFAASSPYFSTRIR